jgi:hypothetical protein
VESFKTTLPPAQNVVGPVAVIEGVIGFETVTEMTFEEAVHPALVFVTLYLPDEETVID